MAIGRFTSLCLRLHGWSVFECNENERKRIDRRPFGSADLVNGAQSPDHTGARGLSEQNGAECEYGAGVVNRGEW